MNVMKAFDFTNDQLDKLKSEMDDLYTEEEDDNEEEPHLTLARENCANLNNQ